MHSQELSENLCATLLDFSSSHVCTVYVFIRVWPYVCVWWCVQCVNVWGDQLLSSSVFLNVLYLTETGFFPWTKSSQVWLASLASLLWGIPIFQALPWELQAGWHWYVFQSSKLWSSCFQNVRYFNHRSISPFFLWLQSIQINLFSFSPSFCLSIAASLSLLSLSAPPQCVDGNLVRNLTIIPQHGGYDSMGKIACQASQKTRVWILRRRKNEILNQSGY